MTQLIINKIIFELSRKMILKNFEINKIDLEKNKFLLFYGKNEGFKSEVINNLIKDKEGILNYEEKEILENEESFENIFRDHF